MYWFCGVNDNSQEHKEMYLTALQSGITHTTLTPILIYDGTDELFCAEVIKHARLLRRKTLLYNKPAFSSQTDEWKATACGAFLRIDIPVICKELGITDEYVLYTDTDVIFMEDVVDDLQKYTPKFFSICPEKNTEDYIGFNSGVMLINVQSMFDTYPQFVHFMENANYQFSAYDQGALQNFYYGHTERLPIIYNFKPYWGVDESAKIIHYHGPKYYLIMEYLHNKHKIFHDLFEKVSTNGWLFYRFLYESTSEGFNWKTYLDKNPDLRQTGIYTQINAVLHYGMYGKKEGRSW